MRYLLDIFTDPLCKLEQCMLLDVDRVTVQAPYKLYWRHAWVCLKNIEILIVEKIFSIDTSTRYFCLCIFNDTLKGRAFLLGHKHTFFESVFHSWGFSFGRLTLVNEHWLYIKSFILGLYIYIYLEQRCTSISDQLIFFHFLAIWEQNIFTPELDSVYTFLRDKNFRLSVCQFVLCDKA